MLVPGSAIRFEGLVLQAFGLLRVFAVQSFPKRRGSISVDPSRTAAVWPPGPPQRHQGSFCPRRGGPRDFAVTVTGDVFPTPTSSYLLRFGMTGPDQGTRAPSPSPTVSRDGTTGGHVAHQNSWRRIVEDVPQYLAEAPSIAQPL